MAGGRMKGPVTVNAGWACAGTNEGERAERKLIFLEDKHSICEMHIRKIK